MKINGNRKAGVIGLSFIFAGMEGSYISEFIRGAVKSLDQKAISLMLINGDQKGKGDIPLYQEYINEKKIDGLLLAYRPDLIKHPELKKAIDEGFPVAFSGQPFSQENIPLFSIYNDRAEYLFSAMEYFYNMGHKSILMCQFDDQEHLRIFQQGRKKFEEKYGKSMDIVVQLFPLHNADVFSRKQFLQTKKNMENNQCTGIFVLSMGMAKDLKKHFELFGISVPEDISVLSFSWENDEKEEPFDCVKVSVFDLSYFGMKMLTDYLSGEKKNSNSICLQHRIFGRGTVDYRK